MPNIQSEFVEYSAREAEEEFKRDLSLWNDDMFDFYNDEIESGEKPERFRFLETTFRYLAKLGTNTACGYAGGNCFFKMIKWTSSETRIRCLLDTNDNTISSPQIYVESAKEAWKIETLAGESGGVLRHEFNKPGWNYFETE